MATNRLRVLDWVHSVGFSAFCSGEKKVKISHDIIDEYVEKRLVTKRKHPEYDLWILNYTPMTQYSQTWDDVTKICRGLIVDAEGKVVSRPFDKFYNIGEHEADDFVDLPKTFKKAYEKFDGSLGISYVYEDKVGVATRGSFESEQALHATELLNREHLALVDKILDNPEYTFLFEIIYPENRVVVDYGDEDKLVLLAIRHVPSGDYTFDHHKASAHIEVALAVDELKEKPNSEGYVLYYDNGLMAKMKHEEYVRLHRLLTQVSNKSIWELLKNGESLDELLDNIPDEFYDWIKETKGNLLHKYSAIAEHIEKAYQEVKNLPTRKEQALALEGCSPEVRAGVFASLDGKPVSEIIWKSIKPKFEKPFRKDIDAWGK